MDYFKSIFFHQHGFDQTKISSDIGKNTNLSIINRSDIRLLTYNLFLRPVVHTNGNDYKKERLGDFLDELENYDIICLQEVFGFMNNRKSHLIYEAAKRGFYFFAEPPETKLFSTSLMDGGILILSRFEIEKIEFYDYSYGIFIDAAVTKGLLYVKIKVKNTYLHLFNTHLQAAYYTDGENLIHMSFLTRKTQIEEMGQYIGKCLKENYSKDSYKDGEKVILCGDLNVDPNFGEMKWLYNEFNKEYEFLLKELNSRDFKVTNLYHTTKGHHPITFGGDDRILYHPAEVNTFYNFDYIFEIEYKPPIEEESEVSEILIIDYDSIKIEKFKLSEEKQKKRVYTQLSDHFGLTLSFKINDNK